MNNIHYLLDLKMSLAGIAFLAISFSGFEVSLKIIGSVLFISYTIRRWYILEKNHKKGNHE
jgi:hypothetical protein